DAPQPPRSPFDDEDADLVLRSSDGVDFWVYKAILGKASSVFQGMFTLPDAPAERQVVELIEDADVLERLLRIVCPVDRPKFASLRQIRPVFAAAEKYMMPFVATSLTDTLRTFIESDPLDVYAIAYLHRMHDVAVAAARRLLEDPRLAEPAIPPPEFDIIPARALYEILAYLKRCTRAAVDVVEDWQWMVRGDHVRAVHVWKRSVDRTKSWVWLTCADAHKHENTPSMSIVSPALLEYNPPRWWWDYVDNLRRELAIKPLGHLALDSSIIGPSVEKAASCPTCAPNALGDLVEYGKMLSKRIDAATAEV
ncbi:hypothetical protein C8Q73DRAFT_614976, partial [Cubamyces lactineus]